MIIRKREKILIGYGWEGVSLHDMSVYISLCVGRFFSHISFLVIYSLSCTSSFNRKTIMVLRIPVTLLSVPEKFLIVCESGNETIQWLCENAYKRYMETYNDQTIPFYLNARRTVDRRVLALEEHVRAVLNDNEPIEIGKIEMIAKMSGEKNLFRCSQRIGWWWIFQYSYVSFV